MYKKYLQILFIIIIFSASGFITYKILLSKFTKNNESSSNKQTETGGSPASPIIGKSQSINLLMLGYGGAGHDGGNLSDVIIVVNVNSTRKVATFISIPRDLWVQIPVRSDLKQNFKINAAYAIGNDDKRYGLKEPQYRGETGAGNLIKKVVSDTTALRINNYIAVDFEHFKNLIDTLGGIEVEVPITFNDYYYPIKGQENATCGFSIEKISELHQKYSGDSLNQQFTCRYEHLHFDKGVQKIDGETALKFVRSRHSSEDGGDFARSRRQKAVLLGMKDKLISLSSVKKIDEIFNEFKGLVRTDIDVNSLKQLSKILGSPKDYKLNFVSLNDENVLLSSKSLDGQFILIPKEGENVWVGLQKYINDEINK